MGFASDLVAVYKILVWMVVNNSKTYLILLQTLLGFKKACTWDLSLGSKVHNGILILLIKEGLVIC